MVLVYYEQQDSNFYLQIMQTINQNKMFTYRHMAYVEI